MPIPAGAPSRALSGVRVHTTRPTAFTMVVASSSSSIFTSVAFGSGSSDATKMPPEEMSLLWFSTKSATLGLLSRTTAWSSARF